jgi:hypothetical protein
MLRNFNLGIEHSRVVSFKIGNFLSFHENVWTYMLHCNYLKNGLEIQVDSIPECKFSTSSSSDEPATIWNPLCTI